MADDRKFLCRYVNKCRIVKEFDNIPGYEINNSPIILKTIVPAAVIPLILMLRETTTKYFCIYSKCSKKAGKLFGECGLIKQLNRGEKVEGILEARG